MVLIQGMRDNAFGEADATENCTTLVVHLDDVAVFDAEDDRVFRVHPDRLIHIAIRTFDLAGFYLAAPRVVIVLSMDAPTWMVGD